MSPTTASTYAVVANFVLLSLALCVTAVVPVGSDGVPVNVGEARSAFVVSRSVKLSFMTVLDVLPESLAPRVVMVLMVLKH